MDELVRLRKVIERRHRLPKKLLYFAVIEVWARATAPAPAPAPATATATAGGWSNDPSTV
jgi:hypothetical protein